MSLSALRKEFRHAFKMKRLTRQRGWAKAVARLNLQIMARSRKSAPLVERETA